GNPLVDTPCPGVVADHAPGTFDQHLAQERRAALGNAATAVQFPRIMLARHQAAVGRHLLAALEARRIVQVGGHSLQKILVPKLGNKPDPVGYRFLEDGSGLDYCAAPVWPETITPSDKATEVQRAREWLDRRLLPGQQSDAAEIIREGVEQGF